MSEKNITEEDKEKNIKEILDIVKNNYNQYYERTQNIDNKSGFFIAFHGAVLLLLINPENINKILLTQYQNIEQILKYGFIVVLEISILILAISSICLFICSLKSRNIKYMPTNICEEKYYNCQNIDLNKEGGKASIENSKEVVKICTQYAQSGMFNIFIALFSFALAFAFFSSPIKTADAISLFIGNR